MFTNLGLVLFQLFFFTNHNYFFPLPAKPVPSQKPAPPAKFPNPLSMISNTVVDLKVFLDVVVPAISKGVNFILATIINNLFNLLRIAVSLNTPVPVGPVAVALKPLDNPTVLEVLILLTKLLNCLPDASLVL